MYNMSTPAVVKLVHNPRSIQASPAIQLDLAKVRTAQTAQKENPTPTPTPPKEQTRAPSLSHPVQDQDDNKILSHNKIVLEEIRPVVKTVFERVVDKLREAQIKISPKSIISVVKIAMEVVEQEALKGLQKREVVNEMVLRIIEISPMSEDQKELCRMLVDNDIIGTTVDLVVHATEGVLDVNHARDIAQSTASCCFAFVSRSRK